MTKYEDKFASLGQVNSLNSWDKFQICCKDMCLIRFLLNFAVFCEFLWISRLRYCSKYQKPCTYELRHLHITNWRLKICIWRLHFSGWSPKGDLKIFLISSPVLRAFPRSHPLVHPLAVFSWSHLLWRRPQDLNAWNRLTTEQENCPGSRLPLWDWIVTWLCRGGFHVLVTHRVACVADLSNLG